MSFRERRGYEKGRQEERQKYKAERQKYKEERQRSVQKLKERGFSDEEIDEILGKGRR
jgi:SOS response regulatory protein OraA/RecX